MRFLLILFLLLSHNLFAQNTTVSFHFLHVAGNAELQPDSLYTNNFGEKFSVSQFKYYVSNIVLKDSITGQSQSYLKEYFLIKDDDASSKSISFTTHLKHIHTIEFFVGVDSIKNVTGVQTGSLDPLNGMFWIWNTGYVFAKLEGNSPVAKTPGKKISYHVGGYKQNENALRKVSLHTNIVVSDHQLAINIKADILKWFDGMHAIKIAEKPDCHEPGTLAMQLSDNFSKMFSIELPAE